jgi:ABC-type sugar transport system substrate-binding protein
MTNKRFALLLLVLSLILLLSACAQPVPEEAEPAEQASGDTGEDTTAAEPAGSDEAPLEIVFSMNDMAFPFNVYFEHQAREEADSLGVQMDTMDGQNQVPKQTADMEAVIAKQYGGVVIDPITAEGLAPAVQQVVDAGIPVVTLDRTVYDVETLAHVGADNVYGGEEQGRAILDLFPDGAVIFELTGEPGSSVAIERSEGLHNIIDDHPEIEMACQQTARFRRDQGLDVTENCLSATPDVDVIVAANDEMAFGAIEALKARGLENDVIVIGFDALPEALAMVRDGELFGTVDQFPGEQSRTAIRVLVDYLRTGEAPGEHDVLIEPKLITADNLDEAERASEIE